MKQHNREVAIRQLEQFVSRAAGVTDVAIVKPVLLRALEDSDDLGGHDVSIVHRLLDVVREVAAEVEAQYGGCRVVTNLGRYQDSKHLHFHVGFGDPRK